MQIIDPHVHIWINDPRYPWAAETAEPPAADATPEMLLDLMAANKVEKTVLVQVIHYRWDNAVYLLVHAVMASLTETCWQPLLQQPAILAHCVLITTAH